VYIDFYADMYIKFKINLRDEGIKRSKKPTESQVTS
jgi:hypothetical protein